MTTKTISLEDTFSQLPIKQIKKVSDNVFSFIRLSDYLLIGNGHLFFTVSLDYLETVLNYSEQLKTETLPRQTIITEFTCFSTEIKTVKDFLATANYSSQTTFNPDFYNPDYLKVVDSIPSLEQIETLQYTSPTWDTQATIWENPDMIVILGGILKHRESL